MDAKREAEFDDEAMMIRLAFDKIVKRFSGWVVSAKGMYGGNQSSLPYYIYKEHLGDPEWFKHVYKKPWVWNTDFKAAWDFACKYHGKENLITDDDVVR